MRACNSYGWKATASFNCQQVADEFIFSHVKERNVFITEVAEDSEPVISFVAWKSLTSGKLHFSEVFTLRDTTNKKIISDCLVSFLTPVWKL
jgi:hypothetical protein